MQAKDCKTPQQWAAYMAQMCFTPTPAVCTPVTDTGHLKIRATCRCGENDLPLFVVDLLSTGVIRCGKCGQVPSVEEP